MTSTTNDINETSVVETEATEAPLIKTDRLGRLQITPEHRQMLLDKFDESGMSGLEFAKLHGIKYPTFAHWCQKRKRERNAGPEEIDSKDLKIMDSLREVVTDEFSANQALKIQLGTGIEVSITSESQLALASKLIQQLQSDVS